MAVIKTHVIETRRCKACGLCVANCPKKILGLGKEINEQGYNYVVQLDPDKCIKCNICGVVCPDIAIGVVVEKTQPVMATA